MNAHLLEEGPVRELESGELLKTLGKERYRHFDSVEPTFLTRGIAMGRNF